MTTDEIRTRFLKFFEARGHRIVPSDSLIPAKDPSILFTGAGMNQFKEQFMGHNVTYRCAATSQKCLRTADLENVGRTAGHHTFFEMLGNFSFGDYFKKEAIKWAWEFLTVELKIPKENLHVSIYEEDEEAHNIWLNDIKVPKKKILKLGDKENFWPSEVKKNGPNGPCGPCSEIFFNPYHLRGGMSVEVWNLVFTQFNRKEGGILEPLPTKNIDTGMGIERLASVIQGVETNFEIDIFIPIINAICKDLDYKKGKDKENDSHINAIADHIRAITFGISDGVYPSNEERGFVIRKLIRRATQRALQVKPGIEPFLYKLMPVVAKVMKGPYPEVEKQRETISQIVKTEEERFQNIILNVLPSLKEEFIKIRDSGKRKISGEVIFKYSDEKGVPFDFQKEIAEGLGLELDEGGFNKFLDEQKERSRLKSKISKEIFAAPSGLLRKKEEWDEASKEKIRMNHTATHLLHSALRQVLGEHARQSGSLVYPEKLRFDFTHPKKMERGEIEKVEGIVNKNISAGYEVKKEVMKLEEAKRQGAIALFGEKYGDEVIVRSIGSFSKELCSGDHIDNTKKIRIFKIIQESSISAGTRRIEAIAGDEVYGWLIAQAGKFKGKAMEGLKGLKGQGGEIGQRGEEKILEVEKWINSKDKENLTYANIKKWAGFETELLTLIDEINAKQKILDKEASRQRIQDLELLAEGFIRDSKGIKNIRVVSSVVPDSDASSLRNLVDNISAKVPTSLVILLASNFGGKANLILAVSKDLVKKGINAQELIKPIAACVGGSGGGRPDLVQAGGKDTAKIKEAVEMIYNLIEERV